MFSFNLLLCILVGFGSVTFTVSTNRFEPGTLSIYQGRTCENDKLLASAFVDSLDRCVDLLVEGLEHNSNYIYQNIKYPSSIDRNVIIRKKRRNLINSISIHQGNRALGYSRLAGNFVVRYYTDRNCENRKEDFNVLRDIKSESGCQYFSGFTSYKITPPQIQYVNHNHNGHANHLSISSSSSSSSSLPSLNPEQHEQIDGFENVETCAICFDDLVCGGVDDHKTNCGHHFHVSCLQEMSTACIEEVRKKCPMCKTTLLTRTNIPVIPEGRGKNRKTGTNAGRWQQIQAQVRDGLSILPLASIAAAIQYGAEHAPAAQAAHAAGHAANMVATHGAAALLLG